MKILFLHLSDIHIVNNQTLNDEKIQKLNQALNTLGKVEAAFILVSGDIAQSGLKEQYEIFNSIINKIYDNINNYSVLNNNINIIVVPGNHDIDFDQKAMSRNEIYEQAFTNKMHNSITNDYLEKMQAFFNFSFYNSCFVKDKIIDIKNYDIKGFKIKINLINTAIYSTFKDNISDYDKGLHYLQPKEINMLKNESDNVFSLTVMHHSPEWFHEECCHSLISFINKYNNILMCGHEHINTENVDKINKNRVFKICGGPLCSGDTSIFNAIILDTETKSFKPYKFIWNQKMEIYEKNDGEEINFFNNIKLNNIFYSELKRDDLMLNCDDFSRFFIFPELLTIGDVEERINSFAKFNDRIKDKKLVLINGDDYCGKTTFSKYLFLEISKDKIPVLFEIKKMNSHKINKIVSSTFKEEYNIDEYNWSKFEQEPIEKKLAIVDDADKINKQEYELLIKELKKHFGTIIVFSGNNKEYDILELTKEYLNYIDDTVKFKICPIYNENRVRLINNICKILKPELSDFEIKNKVEIINNSIKKQITMFNLNPRFIILFVKTAVNNGCEFNEGNIFNSVFSSNITNMIAQNYNLDVNITLFILQKIAYYIHINKEYPLGIASFNKIIEHYNEEGIGVRKAINPTVFLNDLINTRILRYTDNFGNLCFTNNSYLAFFIAKEWLRVQEKCVLEKIICNVCFGINADILLFICFLYENAQNSILKVIIDKADEFNKDFEELSFNKRNIKFILQDKQELVLSLPKDDDVISAKKGIDEQERRINKSSTINYINIYDYDENTLMTQSMIFVRQLKYIEIISKTLPDFIHSMETSLIKKYINDIYSFPNKLLYELFKDIDEEIIDVLCKQKLDINKKNMDSNYINGYETLNKTITSLQQISQMFILQIYDIAARYAVNNQTIEALGNFNTDYNINYEFQKAIFYDNVGYTLDMGKILKKIYTTNENYTIKNLSKKIFYKHVLFNNTPIKGDTQSLIDLFIPERNKKAKYFKHTPKLVKNIRMGRKK